MNDKERIMRVLGDAVPHPGHAPRRPAQELPTHADLSARLQALGGRLVNMGDLAELRNRPAWVDEDAEPYVQGLDLVRTDDIWRAEVGYTTADLVVLESGSLLLSAGPGRRRLASLVPEVHVCFARKENVVSTLEEALPRLSRRTSVLITGSSRTADIEGVLVRGVHGPREVWVVLLPGAP